VKRGGVSTGLDKLDQLLNPTAFGFFPVAVGALAQPYFYRTAKNAKNAKFFGFLRGLRGSFFVRFGDVLKRLTVKNDWAFDILPRIYR
jgi:hypothetical protein